jgi:hypothetical protein
MEAAYYVERDKNHKICGAYACEQGNAKELLKKDNPELLAYFEYVKNLLKGAPPIIPNPQGPTDVA